MQKRKTILILEDSQSRLAALRQAIALLEDDFCIRVWSDAPHMIADVESYLPDTQLITLDWHLRPVSAAEPGTGFDVMRYLCKIKPVAPIIVHSSAVREASIMRDQLRAAGWTTEQVTLMQNEQVLNEWLPLAKHFLARR